MRGWRLSSPSGGLFIDFKDEEFLGHKNPFRAGGDEGFATATRFEEIVCLGGKKGGPYGPGETGGSGLERRLGLSGVPFDQDVLSSPRTKLQASNRRGSGRT